MSEKTKNDLSKKFNRGTIYIHWITAILILCLFPMGKYMEGLEILDKANFIKAHAGFGLVVFLLTILRSYYFFTQERPKNLKTGSELNDKLAVWIHNAFYFLIFSIALSGIATMVLGGYVDFIKSGDASSVLPHDAIPPLKGHGIMALIMMILLAMHVLGVLKHYILTKENTLERIS